MMDNLALLNLYKELQNALWLYRGDKEEHKHTATENVFFKRFQTSQQLMFLGDFDLKGLEMPCSSAAMWWITLKQKQDLNLSLSGFEHEWFNQKHAKSYLNNSV